MSPFRDIRAGGVNWQVHTELFEKQNSVLFGEEGLRLTEWLAQGQAQLIKQGADRTVYRVILPGIDFYLKEYRLPNLRARIRMWLRPCKARIEFQHALGLGDRGLPTLQALAVGETARGTKPTCSYFFTRTVPDSVPLGAFLESTFRAWPAPRQTRFRQRLAVTLGELLARMHDTGVSHFDLHPDNFLLRLCTDNVPELYLIDLHAVRLGRPLDWSVARTNLVLLNRWFILRAERSDRLRFMHTYQQMRGSIIPSLANIVPIRRLDELTLTSNL